jgi:uncharacterized surface protein with fasciclin (FAS1) repeats
MAKHDPDDIVTYYFVIHRVGNVNMVRAYSDNKKFVDFYLSFHNCPTYTLKSVTKRAGDFDGIFDENKHDEICLYNALTRDGDKKGSKVKVVVIPATPSEITVISDACGDYMANECHYSYLNGVIPYLKDKYQKALSDILLTSIVRGTVTGRFDKRVKDIEFDQLKLLVKLLPESFG